MAESLTIFGTQFTGVTGIKATDSNNQIKTYIIPQGNISITNNGNNIDVTNYATASVNISNGLPTQHTVHFDFTDTSDTDISVYYNDNLINTMITNYTPTTYNNKIVDSAELDEVEWYTRPMEVWETVYNNTAGFYTDQDPNAYPYCWIPDLADVSIPTGSQWRVTFDGVVYSLTGYPKPNDTSYGAIGNPLYLPNGTDDGSGVPFALYHTAWGAWSGSADVVAETAHTVKIERLVTV